MSVFQWPRGVRARWRSAVALTAASWFVCCSALGDVSSHPKLPPITAAQPADLPAAFAKSEPGGLDDLREIQNHVAKLVADLSPTVVAVMVGDSSGSGVIISEDGLVLTAGHVAIKPGMPVTFTFPNGRTAHGKTLGINEDVDTGLMKITDPGVWPHANLGDLAHARPGDWVMAMGNPGGFDLKRSLVTRLGRIIQIAPEQLQTDCTIFPGDSGGPLFDMHGRVIGIHTSIANAAAENYHVPITQFSETWDELSGLLKRPVIYCGLSIVQDDQGCRIGRIEKNSPAAKASLRKDDRILAVNGSRVEFSDTFERWMAKSRPGDVLELEVMRGKKILTKSITMQSLPTMPTAK